MKQGAYYETTTRSPTKGRVMNFSITTPTKVSFKKIDSISITKGDLRDMVTLYNKDEEAVAIVTIEDAGDLPQEIKELTVREIMRQAPNGYSLDLELLHVQKQKGPDNDPARN